MQQWAHTIISIILYLTEFKKNETETGTKTGFNRACVYARMEAKMETALNSM